MEGSAISRSINGPKRINQSRDPDADGTWTAHPEMANIVSNASKATPKFRVGSDDFSGKDSFKKTSSIRGGQNG